MSSVDGESTDDPLANELAKFDEALAAGDCERLAPPASDINAADAAILAREKSCVRLLRSVWPTPHSRSASTGKPRPGAQIGRFQLQREVGRGGFGTVYLAFDTLLCRDVALKTPHPGTLASAELRRRFLREQQAAAGLNHPNIVPVFDAGEWDEVGYLVTAFIPGPTLAQWMHEQRERVPVHSAARLVADLADAVEHAHRRGVLHRDIKPGNVLLAPVATAASQNAMECSLSDFVPKLTDFGLARLIEGEPGETRTGALLGTPRYMAPEQAEGRHERVGPPTDVYALGVILYELLAGRTPHAGESDLQTLFRISHDEPAPLRRWRAGVPRDLETICGRCLAMAPAARYASAGELADDLHRFMAGDPIRARSVGPVERVHKWARRNPAPAALALLGVLAIAGFAAGGFIYTAQLRSARDDADARRIEALQRERTIRHHVYAAEMQLAHQALRNSDQSRVEEILNRHRPAQNDEDLRGFEWHYLWRLCHAERFTLRGHAGDVFCCAFSPDGRSLITGGKDRVLRVWDPETGTLRRELRGHEDEIGSVAFASDGSRFATTSQDGTIRWWDLAVGRQLACWRIGGGLVDCALPVDKKTLAIGDRDGDVRLLDADNGAPAPRGRLEWKSDLSAASRSSRAAIAKSRRILALAVSPDGRSIAAFREDGTGQVWDAPGGTIRFAFSKRDNAINGAAFSPSGRMIATVGADAAVELWDAASGKRTATLQGHGAEIICVAFSPDERLVASAGSDRAVRVWALPGGTPVRLLRGHLSKIWSVTFSPDGRTIATTSRDATVKLWNVDAGSERQLVDVPAAAPASATAGSRPAHRAAAARRSPAGGPLCFSNDGTVLAVSDRTGRVSFYRPARGRIDATIEAFAPWAIEQLALSPDGGDLVVMVSGGHARCWSNKLGRTIHPPWSNRPDVATVEFSPDGAVIAAAFASGGPVAQVTFWNRQTGEETGWLPDLPGGDIVRLALSPSGKELAVAIRNKVTIWDMSTRQCVANLAPQDGAISRLVYSPDGNLLATAGDWDRTVMLFDARRWEKAPAVFVYPARVTAIAFSSNGRTLVVGGADGIMRFLAVRSGHELMALEAHPGGVAGVAFAPDDSVLASSGLSKDGAGELYLWHGKAANELPAPDALPDRR